MAIHKRISAAPTVEKKSSVDFSDHNKEIENECHEGKNS